jgi:hypothetical protein
MSERVFAMDHKAISAFLIGCKPEEFMKFRNMGDDGVVVIGPDGRKYIYSVEHLEQAEPKMKAAEQAAKPAQPAKRKAPAKRAARKPAARSSAASKK